MDKKPEDLENLTLEKETHHHGSEGGELGDLIPNLPVRHTFLGV